MQVMDKEKQEMESTNTHQGGLRKVKQRRKSYFQLFVVTETHKVKVPKH